MVAPTIWVICVGACIARPPNLPHRGKVSNLSYLFSVEYGFHQFFPVIAELQQEKGRILP